MATREFDESSTCDDVLAGMDLTGQCALVTGASGGLGAEAARALAAKGCKVTLVARDKSKTEAAVAAIKAEHPQADIDYGLLELSQPDSVNAFANQWLQNHQQLDMLILNAGVMACPLQRTSAGWEMQLATNHFGHFLLTSRLMGVLQNSAPARVVSLSSGGHMMSPVLLDDPHFKHNEYEPWTAYGQSKTANIWFANELDRRYQSQGVRACAVHPGVIHTDLSRHLTAEVLEALSGQIEASGEQTKSIAAGAATSVYAATAPELQGKGGIYLADCQVIDDNARSKRSYAEHAFAPEQEGALWQLTEETLGHTFGA